jgi:hypothetical protein
MMKNPESQGPRNTATADHKARVVWGDPHYFAFAVAQVDSFAGWWLAKKSSRL